MTIRGTNLQFVLAMVLSFASGEFTRAAEPAELADVRARAVFAPRPEYPYEARRARITGSGIVEIEIDPATGKVSRALMRESTGHVVLDQEAIRTFSRWRFKPGTVSLVRSPITFTTTGRGTAGVTYEVKRSSMDLALEPFLGRGNVLAAPMPNYPVYPPWTNKRGRGVYELHIGKDGKVEGAKILKSSGDATFDEIITQAFPKWCFGRKPLIVELPLSFTLTPTSYRVSVR